MSVSIIIIIATCLVSFPAFQNHEMFYRLCFQPARIWHNKEWYRMFTGALLHADFTHLLFNMMSLYFFGPMVESYFSYYIGDSVFIYVSFYILAAVVAHMPDLFMHKNDYNYRGVGASGAVSAVIFAAILFEPLSTLYIQFFIPLPAVVFGVGYLVYSVYMSRKMGDNIAHLAHFGGAVFGFVVPIILYPNFLLLFFEQIKNVFQ